MKKLFVLFMMAFLTISLAACNQTTQEFEVAREDQFIVGLEVNYAPFNYGLDFETPYTYPVNNFDGKFADGYDVQIAKAVASSLGKVLVIQQLEWDALIPQLQSGKIDAIIAGMSPTEDRKTSVLFSDGYYESKHVLLALNDSKYINAKTLNDFVGAKIVGQHGTVYDDLIPQLVGAVHQTPLPNIPSILSEISGRKSDATILELPVATGIVAKNPEFKIIELEDGFTVSEEERIVSIALRLDDTALRDQINLILAGISEEVRVKLMMQAVERSNG